MPKDFASRKQEWLVQLVTSQDNLGVVALKVAILLSTYLNRETEDAWPSQQLLARRLGIARPQVSRAMKRLFAAGHLEGRKVGRANHYRMRLIGNQADTNSRPEIGNVPRTNQAANPVPDRPAEGTDAVTRSVSPEAPNRYLEGYPNKRENQVEKGRAHARPLIDTSGEVGLALNDPSPYYGDHWRACEGAPSEVGNQCETFTEHEAEYPSLTLNDLEQFEAAYPRKESRQNWQSAYYALSGRYTADDILMRAKEYAIEFVGRRGDAERPSEWLARCF